MIKKILVLMAFGSCFAAPWDNVTLDSATGSVQCAKSCDPGTIMKVLNVDSEDAKTLSKTACQVSCADKCFSKKMNDTSTKPAAGSNSTEVAALQCKDSLKETFKLK